MSGTPDTDAEAVGTPAIIEPPRPMHERLVDAIVIDGLAVAEAAKVAGYSSPSAAYNALRRDSTREYRDQLVASRLADLSSVAVDALERLVSGAKSEKVRLDAAVAILDRTGHAPGKIHGPLGGINIQINL